MRKKEENENMEGVKQKKHCERRVSMKRITATFLYHHNPEKHMLEKRVYYMHVVVKEHNKCNQMLVTCYNHAGT